MAIDESKFDLLLKIAVASGALHVKYEKGDEKFEAVMPALVDGEGAIVAEPPPVRFAKPKFK